MDLKLTKIKILRYSKTQVNHTANYVYKVDLLWAIGHIYVQVCLFAKNINNATLRHICKSWNYYRKKTTSNLAI